MTFPEQIDRLVTKLTELTEKDKVEWKETANATTFLASVDKFVVTINRTGSEVSGGLSFQILDRTGKAVEGLPLMSAATSQPLRTLTGSASATCMK
jgi:hypothetical protein